MDERSILDRRRILLLAGVTWSTLTALSVQRGPTFASPKKRTSARLDSQKKKKKNKKKEKRNSSNSNGSRKKGQSRANSGNGDAIVREAKKYKGAKYVWAGASPKGFDCSGFTWYVYQQVTGNDIGRTVKAQYAQGNSVSRGALQPGDIVFFKNTFQKGLSHCGIFISGSDFIHAENEDTGVVISSLDSDYYGQRYAGARRLV